MKLIVVGPKLGTYPQALLQKQSLGFHSAWGVLTSSFYQIFRLIILFCFSMLISYRNFGKVQVIHPLALHLVDSFY